MGSLSAKVWGAEAVSAGCWLSCPDSQLFLAEAMGGLDSMVPSGQVVEKPVTPEAGPGRELKSRWFLVSFLCFYGFVAQMRPGESFITPYLLSPEKNFTQKQARACSRGRTDLGTRGPAGSAPRMGNS